MSFEVKDYGSKIEIAEHVFNVDVGNINFIEKLMEIQTNGIKELESIKDINEEKDIAKKMAIVKEKITMLTDWINAMLCDSKAVEKILGDKRYAVQNIADLFAYSLNAVSQLQVMKLDEKSKEYNPVK